MKTKTTAGLIASLFGAALLAVPAYAQDVRIGLIGGISGPIAAMAPPMIAASELAISQVNEQGGIGAGGRLRHVIGDGACNPQNATDAATKLVNIDRVIGCTPRRRRWPSRCRRRSLRPTSRRGC